MKDTEVKVIQYQLGSKGGVDITPPEGQGWRQRSFESKGDHIEVVWERTTGRQLLVEG